jgi:hypothetical protein
MIRAILVLSLALFSVNGTTENPVGTSYQIGNVATGDSKDTRFRARNSGSSSVTMSNILLRGAGFTITQTPSPPFVIAPGVFQDIYVHFTGTMPAPYSANFQIVYGGSSISVLVLATVVAAPSLATLATGTGCNGPDPTTNAVSFGSIQSGQTAACAISLKNLGMQSLTVSTVTVTGTAFQLANIIQTPIVLAPGKSFTLLNFAPPAAAVYTGALTVDARNYPFSGTGFTPPLSTLLLEFDAGAPASAQQTMRLTTPAPVAASGSVLLSFSLRRAWLRTIQP